MQMKLKTRTRYMLVGSDFSQSAQEPRLTAFMSQDPKMKQAYFEGKDLYAVIAQSMFNNEYWENLEFYPEGTEIELDGRKVISGSGKEKLYTLEDTDSFELPHYYLVNTPSGEIEASQLKIGQYICTDAGDLQILALEPINDNIKVTLKIS